MPITRKEFEITALSEEGREFIIEERLYVFNQAVTHKIHVKDGGFPFVNYFSAKKVKEKLEKQENNRNFVQREANIYSALVITGLIIILWAIL